MGGGTRDGGKKKKNKVGGVTAKGGKKTAEGGFGKGGFMGETYEQKSFYWQKKKPLELGKNFQRGVKGGGQSFTLKSETTLGKMAIWQRTLQGKGWGKRGWFLIGRKGRNVLLGWESIPTRELLPMYTKGGLTF